MPDFKRRIKILGKYIVFIAFLSLMLMGLSHFIKQMYLSQDLLVPSRSKSLYRVMREKENSIDVIVVGDSLSYSSVSPMVLWKKQGITAFIGGQAGQKIQETYHMLDIVFRKQKPRLVVIETHTMFNGKWGVTAFNEFLVECGNYYLPVLQGHDIWKTLVINKRYCEENYKGFPIRNIVMPYKNGDYMLQTKEVAVISDIVNDYMEKILKLCHDNNAEVLLLSTPSPKNYRYSRHNALVRYAKEKQLQYLDLNLKLEELKMDWNTDSLDEGDHLNLSGAHKVTEYLGIYMKKHYVLPDHRGDKVYEEWEKEADEYDGKTKGYLKEIRK